MYRKTSNYVSPKVEARPKPEKGSWGVFACEPIPKGEMLLMWGGRVVSGQELATLSHDQQAHGVQVEVDLYLAPYCAGEYDAGDFINHSCEPNAGLSGATIVVAMRAIMEDEEICFDYAMTDSSPYDEFECACGTASCRHAITGNDWKRPELQKKYRNYFSPYLQRWIDQLNGHEK